MSMNSPKVFVTAFAVLALILVALLTLSPNPSSLVIDGVVTNQTLTQSLDGHRRFINVTTSDKQSLLIQIDPLNDCPTGSNVTIKSESSLFSEVSSYQLVTCQRTNN